MFVSGFPSVVLGVLAVVLGTPQEGDSQRKNKALLGFMLMLTLFLTVGWTVLHVWLGAYRVAFNLVVYFICNAVALGGMLYFKGFTPWMLLHVASFFVLPWTATWTQGGYEAAGLICIWAGMPVLELGVYRNWLWGTLLLLVHAAVATVVAWGQAHGWIDFSAFDWMDWRFPHTQTGESARLAFYVINTAGTALVALGFTSLARAPDAPPQ
ncbi:MAG: hypothetical protein AB2A00_40650 [Myxococcota bacterium]